MTRIPQTDPLHRALLASGLECPTCAGRGQIGVQGGPMVHTEVDCYDCGGYGCIMDPAVFVQNLSKRHYSLIHTPTLEALREQPLRAHRMERYEAALRAALVALEPIADLHIPSVDRAKWVIASALRKDETT